jgi:hypothetical protein
MRFARRPGVAAVKSARSGAGPEGFSPFQGKTPDLPFDRPLRRGRKLACFVGDFEACSLAAQLVLQVTSPDSLTATS